MNNFWNNLKKPIMILAPMEDVTDVVFREIVVSCARPDVFFTEFTNCDGLMSEGFDEVSKRLKFTENQRPIVAQVWGKSPENYFKAAKLIKEMGFDGIDINMGCPVRDVVAQGSCSALINNHKLAEEIIEATLKGADGLPVSVKTRLGFRKIQTEEWFSFLLHFDLAEITVHGRVASEMSKLPANWEEIGKVAKLRDELRPKTLIIGNGDVTNYKEALEKCEKFGVDGVMIGRGIFNNLFAFDKSENPHVATKEELLNKLREHVILFDKTWGKKKDFNIMKKFFKIYVTGFPGASDLRAKLMEAKSKDEVLQIVDELGSNS